MNFRPFAHRTRYAPFIAAAAISAATLVRAAADDCPPSFVLSDPTGDGASLQKSQDIESLSIEEPNAGAGTEKIVFRVKVGSLETLPSATHWQVSFKVPGQTSGAPQYARMQSAIGSPSPGPVRFVFTGPNGERDAEPESTYSADGTIKIVVAKESLHPGLVAGVELTELSVSTYSNTGVLPGVPHDVAGSQATYILNGGCQLEPPPIRLANIAGRSLVRQGDDVGIGGFIVSAPSAKRVIIRAIGPSLKSGESALTGRMQNPTLEVRSGAGELIGENDDWRASPEAQQIRDSGFAPKDDREAAVIADLEPGAYTAILRGANGTEGIAVIEIYDLQLGTQSELANLASRAFVSTGDNVLIGGFILNGGGGARVLLRAIGSSLAGSVPDELEDPTIEVTNAEGAKVVENDDWRSAPNAAEIEATGAAPTDNRESAGTATLTAGPYTAVVRGARGSTGVGVVEIYRLGVPSDGGEQAR